MKREDEFCAECSFAAGILARIAELEAWNAAGRKSSGVRERVVVMDQDAPPTQREPSITRRLAAGCR